MPGKQRYGCRVRSAALVLAVVSVGLAAIGCSSSISSGGSSIQTPAEKLASLDGGDVATFQQHLDSLKAKCLDSEEKIAALVYGTQKTMAEKGVNESLSSLIAHLDQGFPANAPKQHCDGVFALYVTLRQVAHPPTGSWDLRFGRQAAVQESHTLGVEKAPG